MPPLAWQAAYARMRMYARYHVMAAVAVLLLSTLLFLSQVGSFLKPSPSAASRQSQWQQALAEEASESKPLVTRAPSPPDTPRITVVVLTCDRPYSLERLLLSLNNARYEAAWRVDLIVRQDMPNSGVLSAETARLVSRLAWEHGSLDHVRETEPRGPMQQWLAAYTPVSTQDWFVVLEDDMEVSPFWVRWLIPALQH
eukprot:662954-Hanusia_phi.AAC.1